jgi:hypothetical protein
MTAIGSSREAKSVQRNMTRSQAIWWTAWAWLAVWAAWLWAIPGVHANWTLATIATTAMIGAFAAVSSFNLWVLAPRYWRIRPLAKYWAMLLAAMLGMTGVALAIIRFFYTVAFGPFPVKPWQVDYGIDLVLMILHVAGAAMVARIFRQATRVASP